jgi:hypothetical protein
MSNVHSKVELNFSMNELNSRARVSRIYLCSVEEDMSACQEMKDGSRSNSAYSTGMYYFDKLVDK